MCQRFFMAACLLLALSPVSRAQRYAIQDVSVIPMDRDTLLTHQTILIAEGKIRQLGSMSRVSIPAGYHVISGRGKYVMPGLMDMHAHFYYEQGKHVNTCREELTVMLANGVTTARIMAGHESYLQARKQVSSGFWKGPELRIASPQLAGEWPFEKEFMHYYLTDTPEKAREAVRRSKQGGYDEIKLTFRIKPEVYEAIVDEAGRQGLQITGHVGPFVGLDRSLKAGQQIEHMDEFIEQLLPDTSFNHGQSVSDYNIYNPKAWATVPYLDERRLPLLVQQVKEAGVYVTPTNYFFISCFGEPLDDEAMIKSRPDYFFIPGHLREEKWNYRKRYLQRMESPDKRQRYVQLRLAMVKALWEGDVPLMAGSDSPEFFMVTGFALHDELESFVRAGLTPFAALKTATVNPAKYMKLADRTGSLAVGKEADLLILAANPLEDIRNTRRILGVMSDGRYEDGVSLEQLLETAKKVYQR